MFLFLFCQCRKSQISLEQCIKSDLQTLWGGQGGSEDEWIWIPELGRQLISSSIFTFRQPQGVTSGWITRSQLLRTRWKMHVKKHNCKADSQFYTQHSQQQTQPSFFSFF